MPKRTSSACHSGRSLGSSRARHRLPVECVRGAEHEAQFVQALVDAGRSLRDLRERHDPAATLAAMREGVDVIVQAPLCDAAMRGRADVLLRLDPAPAGQAFGYEPYDTKLARETKAGTLLQLVWPDMDGHFPDDPAYAGAAQPIHPLQEV